MADRVRTVQLGASDVHVTPLAVGTWAWGDKPFWGYETEFGARDIVDAFGASLEAGITFFDTAEVYGHGESEKILGWLARKSGAELTLATKFAPLRERSWDLRKALSVSLKRMGVSRVDLYQVHWCDSEMVSIASLAESLIAAVREGLVRAVGVSNFSATEMREMHARLGDAGVPLASNQVEYSLLERAPETNGVLETCRELNVTLLAYSPLAQGILNGKYGVDRVPPGRRGEQSRFAREALVRAERVVSVLREIGRAHDDAGPGEIALAWLMAQTQVVPVAGAKTGEHAARNARALAVKLTDDECAHIARVSESAG